jgi:hypothetical protein
MLAALLKQQVTDQKLWWCHVTWRAPGPKENVNGAGVIQVAGLDYRQSQGVVRTAQITNTYHSKTPKVKKWIIVTDQGRLCSSVRRNRSRSCEGVGEIC